MTADGYAGIAGDRRDVNEFRRFQLETCFWNHRRKTQDCKGYRNTNYKGRAQAQSAKRDVERYVWEAKEKIKTAPALATPERLRGGKAWRHFHLSYYTK